MTHERLGPASDDPDIRQAWTDLRQGLDALIRPYVSEVSRDDLVRRIIAELVAGPGWKPPLKPVPDFMVQARVARALASEDLA
ncbi:hypothetical protein [Sphaerimonospora thailandensis]|uniref:Uncharacterized protein n=1 Tax=Sphaerimonospora thailandensis TaxID=795644 RepID=A0A8J3R7K0_9ACTN|nr:hypothetical protein [Sphaerimonospora thailandensis]GIH69464.1 hypothetical protein Mth01_17170 [Sphaerimonospora thailandensis]